MSNFFPKKFWSKNNLVQKYFESNKGFVKKKIDEKNLMGKIQSGQILNIRIMLEEKDNH